MSFSEWDSHNWTQDLGCGLIIGPLVTGQEVKVLNLNRIDSYHIKGNLFFEVRVVQHLNRLSRDAVDATSPEMFKVRSDGSLTNLINWKIFCQIIEVGTGSLKVPSKVPSTQIILWLHDSMIYVVLLDNSLLFNNFSSLFSYFIFELKEEENHVIWTKKYAY